MHKQLNKNDIAAFLHFGYVPKARPVHLDKLFDRHNIALNPVKSTVPENESIETGIAILDATFHNIAKQVGSKPVVIPISGGMDSRAILAGMLKHLPKTQISTVTLGIPGALDYEIGQQVARVAGVANKAINLNDLEWKEDNLLEYAAKFHSPIAFVEGYLFSQVFSDFTDSDIVLSGFMGDALSGAHLSLIPSIDNQQACAYFAEWNHYSKTSTGMPGRTSSRLLNNIPKPHGLCLDDMCDLLIRQRIYIRPLVLLKGYYHKAPFLAPDWISFMLNLPYHMRRDQSLYKKILCSAYPDLFSLPLKNELGLSLQDAAWKKHAVRCINKLQRIGSQKIPWLVQTPVKHLNYIDFEKSYRENNDLKSIAEKSITDLDKRGVVSQFDILKLWHQHQNKTRNYAQLINLLVSLELFYKSRDVIT